MSDPNSHRTPAVEPTPSSRFRDKVGGATQVIHGFGENIRGTFLGAVDTVLGNRVGTQNDEIARLGRLETESGLAKLRGTGHTGPPSAVPPADWTDSHPGREANRAAGPGPYTGNAGDKSVPVKGDPTGGSQNRYDDGFVDLPATKPYASQEPTKG